MAVIHTPNERRQPAKDLSSIEEMGVVNGVRYRPGEEPQEGKPVRWTRAAEEEPEEVTEEEPEPEEEEPEEELAQKARKPRNKSRNARNK